MKLDVCRVSPSEYHSYCLRLFCRDDNLFNSSTFQALTLSPYLNPNCPFLCQHVHFAYFSTLLALAEQSAITMPQTRYCPVLTSTSVRFSGHGTTPQSGSLTEYNANGLYSTASSLKPLETGFLFCMSLGCLDF